MKKQIAKLEERVAAQTTSIEELNEKCITMEEDQYQMETMQLDLVEELKEMEVLNEEMEKNLKEVSDECDKLDRGVYIGHKASEIDVAM